MKKLLILLLIFFAQTSYSVTLEDAFQAALTGNEIIQQSHETVNQAEEQLIQAKSTVYPNLSFNASHMVNPETDNAVAQQFLPEEQTQTNFTLKQPLFRGFREYAGIRQRKKNVSSAKQSRIVKLAQTYEQVSESYLEVLALEQDLKNLGEQRELYATRIKDLQARIKRGESNSTEALTAQSTEAALVAEIKITESKLTTARENFKRLTGLPANSNLDDVGIQNKADMSKLKPIGEYLSRIEERPDVISAREQVEMAQEEVSIAKGGHWPTLDLVGNYYLQRPSGYLSDMKWDVKLELTFPLFEGGRVMSQTREAASKKRVQDLELSRIRKQAEADIVSLHDGLKNRVEQLLALQRASELAEKNYQVLQKEFKRGLSRSIDVQLALTEFRVARRGYDQARYAARLDWIKLQIATAHFPDAITKEL